MKPTPSLPLLLQFDWQVDPASPPGAPWSRCVVAALCCCRAGMLPLTSTLPASLPRARARCSCLDMVWRAVGAGSDRLNFVPTHHWLAAPDGANAVGSYCYMQHADAGGSEAAAAAGARAGRNRCFPWSDAVVGQFRQGMALCFAEALRQGMTLYVRPHLDDGSAQVRPACAMLAVLAAALPAVCSGWCCGPPCDSPHACARCCRVRGATGC